MVLIRSLALLLFLGLGTPGISGEKLSVAFTADFDGKCYAGIKPGTNEVFKKLEETKRLAEAISKDSVERICNQFTISELRAKKLLEETGYQSDLLILENNISFFSRIGGRYRYEVAYKISLYSKDRTLVASKVGSFSVFLERQLFGIDRIISKSAKKLSKLSAQIAKRNTSN